MDKQKLDLAIQTYKDKHKDSSIYNNEDWADRQERRNYYQSWNADKISKMNEDDLYEYVGKLWSMLIWGNKKYVVDKLIEDNGLTNIKEQLIHFLYGKQPIEYRWKTILNKIKGIGPATVSELLAYVNPKEYAIFNNTTVKCFTYLGIENMPKYNYQYTGEKYVEVCQISKTIQDKLLANGIPDVDLLVVDYFLWDEILPLIEKSTNLPDMEPIPEDKISDKDYSSVHDEIKEKIVTIGNLLGFDSRSEVKIATGSIVDAIWEAKIGNMGKAIYVFEVQSKGSIDSLILNLKKAQSNAAVQAIVAVADEKQLEKIINESQGVIEEKALRTWDFDDVLIVHDALVRAHESINKLSLVPESF